MARWHIDLQGNPARCTAEKRGCPRQTHADSPEAAREAWEASMEGETFAAASHRKKAPAAAPQAPQDPQTPQVPQAPQDPQEWRDALSRREKALGDALAAYRQDPTEESRARLVQEAVDHSITLLGREDEPLPGSSSLTPQALLEVAEDRAFMEAYREGLRPRALEAYQASRHPWSEEEAQVASVQVEKAPYGIPYFAKEFPPGLQEPYRINATLASGKKVYLSLEPKSEKEVTVVVGYTAADGSKGMTIFKTALAKGKGDTPEAAYRRLVETFQDPKALAEALRGVQEPGEKCGLPPEERAEATAASLHERMMHLAYNAREPREKKRIPLSASPEEFEERRTSKGQLKTTSFVFSPEQAIERHLLEGKRSGAPGLTLRDGEVKPTVLERRAVSLRLQKAPLRPRSSAVEEEVHQAADHMRLRAVGVTKTPRPPQEVARKEFQRQEVPQGPYAVKVTTYEVGNDPSTNWAYNYSRGSSSMNDLMSGSKGASQAEDRYTVMSTVKALDWSEASRRGRQDHEDTPFLVHRGGQVSSAEGKGLAAMRPGMVFQTTSLMSTSLEEARAREFAHPHDRDPSNASYRMEIATHRGKVLKEDESQYSYENEVLLPRGMSLTCYDRTTDPDGTIVLKVYDSTDEG